MNEALLQVESRQVLAALRRMAGDRGRLLTSSAIAKLSTSMGLSRLEIHEALRDLYRSGLVNYQPDARQLPASAHITVQAAAVVPAAHDIAWRNALDVAQVDAATAADLAALAPMVADLGASDMQALLRGLQALRAGPAATCDDAGFNVSARHLMGSSKVLAKMPRQMLDALHIPSRVQLPSPRYILCAGPPAPVATLLIENPRAFENAVRSGLADDVAIVCTFGYGLSYLGIDLWAGDQATQHDRPILIVRSGKPPPLDQLLTAQQVFLWADLDLAAMNIFRSLKGAIPQLQMSAIYEVMLPMLSDPARSHPYAALFEKSGQLSRYKTLSAADPRVDDEDMAMLQAACAERAVDQEAVHESSIRQLGARPFGWERMPLTIGGT